MRTKYVNGEHYSLSPIEPVDVSDVELAFSANVKHLMPAQSEIDKIPKETLAAAERFVSTWFSLGLDQGSCFGPAEGVEPGKAARHLRACMTTFESKHEDKLLGCAALVSTFFRSARYAPPEAKDHEWVEFTGFVHESSTE